MKSFTRVFLGLLLILTGTMCILKVVGLIDIDISLNGWWTFFIIIPCLNGFLTNHDKFGSLIGLIVGILLLLAAQDVFAYGIVLKLIVPIIIILLGFKLLKKNSDSSNCKKRIYEQGDEYSAVFSAQNVNFDNQIFKFARVGAIFGATRCDVSNAQITDGSKIELMCAFGGAEVVVPKNVNVSICPFCLFGAVSDKREIKAQIPNAPTLYIDGFCIFGGADILS